MLLQGFNIEVYGHQLAWKSDQSSAGPTFDVGTTSKSCQYEWCSLKIMENDLSYDFSVQNRATSRISVKGD